MQKKKTPTGEKHAATQMQSNVNGVDGEKGEGSWEYSVRHTGPQNTYADFTKQDSGGVRQNSRVRARMTFS